MPDLINPAEKDNFSMRKIEKASICQMAWFEVDPHFHISIL